MVHWFGFKQPFKASKNNDDVLQIFVYSRIFFAGFKKFIICFNSPLSIEMLSITTLSIMAVRTECHVCIGLLLNHFYECCMSILIELWVMHQEGSQFSSRSLSLLMVSSVNYLVPSTPGVNVIKLSCH